MGGWADQYKFIFPQIVERKPSAACGKRNETEVGFTFGHPLIDLGGSQVFNFNLHRWIGFAELLQILRQFMQPDTVDRRNQEFSGNHRLQLLQAVAQTVVGSQDFFAGMQERPAFGRNREVLFSTLDQWHFELFFERPDLLTHGALGDGIQFGSFGETRRFDKVTKDLKCFDLH